jgi:mono/diheme cytochrome c family protein
MTHLAHLFRRQEPLSVCRYDRYDSRHFLSGLTGRRLSSKANVWEECRMLRAASISSVILPLVLFGTTPAAFAQDQESLGMRLFNQSCRVCHTKPQLTSPQYGPALSKETLGGKADLLREFISNGTARMPGFKYHFKPAEIDAIVSYLKTVPVPAAASPVAGKTGDTREAD